MMIEVIDISDDERYFPIGYFSDLYAANAAIDRFIEEDKDHCPPCADSTEASDGVVLEMRLLLEIGWTSPVPLQRRDWECFHDPETEQFIWKECLT